MSDNKKKDFQKDQLRLAPGSPPNSPSKLQSKNRTKTTTTTKKGSTEREDDDLDSQPMLPSRVPVSPRKKHASSKRASSKKKLAPPSMENAVDSAFTNRSTRRKKKSSHMSSISNAPEDSNDDYEEEEEEKEAPGAIAVPGVVNGRDGGRKPLIVHDYNDDDDHFTANPQNDHDEEIAARAATILDANHQSLPVASELAPETVHGVLVVADEEKNNTTNDATWSSKRTILVLILFLVLVSVAVAVAIPLSSSDDKNQDSSSTVLVVDTNSSEQPIPTNSPTLLPLPTITLEDDPCDVQSSTSRSENWSAATNDDAVRNPSKISKLDDIEKILSIAVYSGTYFFNTVVTKMDVTYQLVNGEQHVYTRGNGGDLQGTATFEDGVYLNSIRMQEGAYVDYVEFCATNGRCFGPWGGKTNLPGRILTKSNSVIKALFGTWGSVIDRLGCHFETNKLFRIQLMDIAYRPVKEDLIVQQAQSTELDNSNSVLEQSKTEDWSETFSTNEVTRFTRQPSFINYPVSMSLSPDMTLEFLVLKGGGNLTIGSSFDLSALREFGSAKQDFETRLAISQMVVIPPLTKVTVEILYEELDYIYQWDAPIQCFFQHQPTTPLEGSSFQGTIEGSQINSGASLQISTE